MSPFDSIKEHTHTHTHTHMCVRINTPYIIIFSRICNAFFKRKEHNSLISTFKKKPTSSSYSLAVDMTLKVVL